MLLPCWILSLSTRKRESKTKRPSAITSIQYKKNIRSRVFVTIYVRDNITMVFRMDLNMYMRILYTVQCTVHSAVVFTRTLYIYIEDTLLEKFWRILLYVTDDAIASL